MTVLDPACLALFRGYGVCLFCKKRRHREPHHMWCRGMGGGSQVDIPVNIADICAKCHRSHHDGNEPTHEQLLALVASRERLLQRDIEAVMDFLARVPNRPIAGQIDEELDEMPAAARAIVKTILKRREAA